MRKLFVSMKSKDADGWLLGAFGNSGIDAEDYMLDTNYLHGDEIPDPMSDAKTGTEMTAGLLNAYYNGISVIGMTEDEVMKFGIPDKD